MLSKPWPALKSSERILLKKYPTNFFFVFFSNFSKGGAFCAVAAFVFLGNPQKSKARCKAVSWKKAEDQILFGSSVSEVLRGLNV